VFSDKVLFFILDNIINSIL